MWDEKKVQRFRELSRPYPSAEKVRAAIGVGLLGLAALFIGGAIIFFFAANWQQMDRFTKLGSLALAFVGCAFGSFRCGFETTAGRSLQVVAYTAAGALLAVYGQIYQTGADSYEIFAWWALLLLPWTLASRWPVPWIWTVVLADVALMLAMGQELQVQEEAWYSLASAALTGVAWGLWEWACRGPKPELGKTFGPGVLAPATFCALIPPAVSEILGVWEHETTTAAFLALCGLIVFSLTTYRAWIGRRLLVPTLGLASTVILVSAFVAEKLDLLGVFDGAAAWFVVGLLIVAQVSGALWILRRLAAAEADRGEAS